MTKKVFLGGTCANSEWREELIKLLKIDYFNPVVDDWNDEAYQRELYEREHCDFCLYVITPNLEGFYSIAEVTDDSNKRPEKAIFCVLEADEKKGEPTSFNEKQMKSLVAVGKMVKANGGQWFNSLQEVADYLNR